MKIGITTYLSRRIEVLQAGNPFPLQAWHALIFERRSWAAKTETIAHAMLKDRRLTGE